MASSSPGPHKCDIPCDAAFVKKPRKSCQVDAQPCLLTFLEPPLTLFIKLQLVLLVLPSPWLPVFNFCGLSPLIPPSPSVLALAIQQLQMELSAERLPPAGTAQHPVARRVDQFPFPHDIAFQGQQDSRSEAEYSTESLLPLSKEAASCSNSSSTRLILLSGADTGTVLWLPMYASYGTAWLVLLRYPCMLAAPIPLHMQWFDSPI